MVTFRRYDSRDGEAIRRLNSVAFRNNAVDPADIPGIEDLDDVEGSYFDVGGAFLVGVATDEEVGEDWTAPAVHDGRLVAMGGFVPNRAGRDDERTVEGAVELHRMRVTPEAHGAGYGRELLERLESAIRKTGLDPILATTSKRQRRAVEFYEAAGYDRVAESTDGDYELVHFEKSLR
ncbi:MAG: GNAT family N-acetyltransferase [Natronomonas sp.]